MKNSEIIICKGIEMDKGYENVLSYSESDMVTLCRNNAVYTANYTSILGAKEDYIDLGIPFAKAMYANYMAFNNHAYGNKWMFAFITEVKYMSDSTTRIFYQIDVWSTWYSKFKIGKAFIEREHVDDDTRGKHTIPENVETGDYVVNFENKKKALTPLNVIMASNVDPVLDSNNELVGGDVGGGIYNDIRTGFKYYHFANDTTSSLPTVLKAFSEAGKADSILALFLTPFNAYEKNDSTVLDNGQVKETTVVKTLTWVDSNAGDTLPTFPTQVDGYTPVNAKVLTFPYCYLRLTNNNGNDAIYYYEKFTDNVNHTINFGIDCAICPGMSIIAYPKDYDGITSNYNQCLQAGKFPVCGWASDSYTNWLTQNSVNIATSLASSALQVVAGAGMAATGMASGILGMASGVNSVASTLGTVYQHSLTPMEAKGNLNTGDVKTSADINTFTLYGMSIKKEYAKVIDQYFSKYGYQVNEVKTPNLKTRTQFNFIKVGGLDDLVHGDIPASDLEEINNIFRKGVTIFHNYSNFGNYTISNPIRSS